MGAGGNNSVGSIGSRNCEAVSSALVNAAKEIRIVRTAIFRRKLRHVILSRCREDSFGYDAAYELYQRVVALQLVGERISATLLAEDPNLSRDAQNIVRSQRSIHKPYRHRDDVVEILGHLEDLRRRRAAFYASEAIARGIEEGAETDAIVSQLESSLLDARTQGIRDSMYFTGQGSERLPEQSTSRIVNKILAFERPPLLKSGFVEFDRRSGGFARGDAVAVMAPRGCGKSSMINSRGVHMYLRENMSVCIVNLELTEEQIIQRILALLTNIPHDKIRLNRLTNRERLMCKIAWESFQHHGRKNGCRFVIWATPKLSADEVSAVLPSMGFDVIILDYLTLMDPPAHLVGADKKEVLDANAQAMKRIAKNKRHPCVVFMLVHMTNTWEVKYSRAVENHVDFIWAWLLKRRDKKLGVARIRQTKARDAEEFDFTVGVNIKCHQWYSIDPDEDPYRDHDDDFEPHDSEEERQSKPSARRQRKKDADDEPEDRPKKYSESAGYNPDDLEGFESL